MNVIDLFCGCGGLSLGFQEAGFSIVSSFDNWDAATDVYRLNFQHPVHKADLMEDEKVAAHLVRISARLGAEMRMADALF